jgi:uncharacterized protein
MTVSPARQRLRVLPGEFVIEHVPGGRNPASDSWFFLVRAPEGLTVVRPATGGDPAQSRWAGLYGDATHALDLPGMLAALTGPLAAAAIPVFAASAYHADVLLVPCGRWDEALGVLRRAGHEVVPAQPGRGQA